MTAPALRFHYRPVASALHDPDALARLLAPYAAAIENIGGTPAAPDAAPAVPLVAFIQTGGSERLTMDLLAAAPAAAPLLLLAHPAHNSLPASLEILARCRQLGRHASLFLLRSPDDADTLDAFAAAYRAAAAASALRTARIGRFGEPSSWLIASAHDPATVAARFGASLEPIPLDELRAAYRAAPRPADGPEFDLYRSATAVADVPESVFADSVRLARALADLAAQRRLDALTVRCFDLLIDDNVTGCLALALLADAGIPAACEGDIPATLALLWARLLTGRPAWMANPSAIDPVAGSALLAHCTVPFSLTTAHAFMTHFESGRCLAIDGTIPAGPATLLRIGGNNLSLASAIDVEIAESLHRPGLCRTQVRIDLDPADARRWLDAPLGNHVVLAPGHFAREFLASFAYTLPPA